MMRIPEHGLRYPELGDIWCDDDGDYYLLMTEPSWTGDGHVCSTVLHMNTGETVFKAFPVDHKTGTIYDWYWKVA